MSLEVKEYLNKLGLTSTEIDIYLALVTTGPSTILNLSRYTKIKRSTVHFIVESLIKKNFVFETKSKVKRLIVAEDPKRIKEILNIKSENLDNLKIEADRIIRSINSISNKDSNFNDFAEFSYYKGLDNIADIYKQTLSANFVYSFSNLDRYYKTYPGSRKLFVNALNKNKDRVVKTIAVDSYLSRQIEKTKINDHYKTKFISEDFFDNADIHIYDGKTAIITLDKNPSGVVIKSQIITTSLTGLHNVLWSLL